MTRRKEDDTDHQGQRDKFPLRAPRECSSLKAAAFAADSSEANNLATAQPEKLRRLQEMFWVEAAMHNALPIDVRKIFPSPSETGAIADVEAVDTTVLGIVHPRRTTETGQNTPLPLDFKYDGGGQGKGGTATLSVDGAKAGETRFDTSTPLRISLDETLDCGEDTGTPVSEDYKVPFRFTGEIIEACIELK